MKARYGKPARPAKGVTQREFIDFMKRAQEAVYTRLQDPAVRARWEQQVGPWGLPENDPIFSFDNPNIHGGRDPMKIMKPLRLDLDSHFELPANSSDIHKVIEHTHGRLVKVFQDWLYADSTKYSLPTYKTALEQIFYKWDSVASHTVIDKDVKSLPALFAEVVRLEGGWPKKCWR